MSQTLVIGTRGSALARWQADHVGQALRRAHAKVEIEQRVIVTEGDRTQGRPPIELGGKGVWVKEIEEALLAGAIDLAVHSLKDLPAKLPDGLTIAAIPPRADARDALVSNSGHGWDALPAGSRLGTSSLRRACQARARRPDLVIQELRGNVDTRLRKVAAGEVDAAVLACAGLDRLGLADRIVERIPIESMLPAVGQGALAIEARSGDPIVLILCRKLADRATELAVAAERALLLGLGAGCRTPVAGHATIEDDGARVVVRAMVGRPDASEILKETAAGSADEAAQLGEEVARRLLRRGADRILRELG